MAGGGAEGGVYIYILSQQTYFCIIKNGSGDGHFNVPFPVRDKVTRLLANHTFSRERRAEAV